MTRATSEGVSELRQPSWWSVFSTEGLHERVGLDAIIRARLIRVANSPAGEEEEEEPNFITFTLELKKKHCFSIKMSSWMFGLLISV